MKTVLWALCLLLAVLTRCDGLKHITRQASKQNILDPNDSTPDDATNDDLTPDDDATDATADPKTNPILTLMGMQNDKNDNVVKVTPTPKPDPYDESRPPRGRIQILTSSREPTCLARAAGNTKGLFYLVVAPCEYNDDQFFVYQRSSQRLMMADRMPSPAHRFVATQANNSQIPGYEGKYPLVLTNSEPGDAYSSWALSLNDFGIFTITTKSDASQVCLQVSDAGVATIAFGRFMTHPKDVASCAALKFMLPEDDYVAGAIRVFNTTAANSKTNLCVTYRDVESPSSVLYTAPCNPLDPNQRFVYNMLTFHLRTANGAARTEPFPYDGPGLFFWWKGRIKSYPDLDEVVNKGYGWLLPLRRAGGVYVSDNRGFSGKCWSRASDGNIMAEQTCDSFGFYPEKDNFFTRRRGPRSERRYTSAFVFVNGTTNCLTMSRVPLKPDDASKGWLLRPYVDRCKMDPMAMHQRWVISQTENAVCDSKSCKGLLRWSGDVFNSLVVPQVWNDYDFKQDRYLTVTTDREDLVPFEFDFPFDRTVQGTIRNVASRAPYSNPMCWTMSQQGFVILGTKNCLTFNLAPPNRFGPNGTQGESVIARFDAKSLMVMPADMSRSNLSLFDAIYRRSFGSNFMVPAQKAQFERFFDMFYPDLGDFGHRRFRLHSGSTFEVRPTGELLVRGGMVFPIMPAPQITSSNYTLIEMSVRFFRVSLKRSGSFLLMSNARASGCIVYSSFGGRIGLKCYKNYQVVAQSHIMAWGARNKKGFSLLTGRFNRVSLLLSTQPGGQVTLLLNTVPIITLPYVWSPAESSPNLYLFVDPYFWQYSQPLPEKVSNSWGTWMYHASVYAANDVNRLISIATTFWRHKMNFFDNSVPAIQAPTDLRTTWSNCTFYRNKKTNLFYALRCTLTPSIRVPVDVLSLTCSRPTCSIEFILPSKVKLPCDIPTADSYDFVYKPNFPATFTSESVGKRPSLKDPSFVSDGFQTRLVSFDLAFVQDNSFSLLETDASIMDLCRYRCLETLNPTLDSLNAQIQDTWGEIF